MKVKKLYYLGEKKLFEKSSAFDYVVLSIASLYIVPSKINPLNISRLQMTHNCIAQIHAQI